MAQFSDHVFNALAPGIPAITACNAPELTVKSSFLMPALLGGILHVKYKPGFFRLVLTMIRRAEQASYEYAQGCEELVRFLELRAKQDDHPSVYARALSHFEQCIFQADLAAGLMSEFCDEDLFKSGDGSEADRLRQLCNHLKHFAGNIRGPERRKPKGKFYEDASVTAPIWITDEGLASSESVLGWSEVQEVLDELLRAAEVLANVPAHDPK